MYHIQHDTIMPIQKYEVRLSAEERKQLTKIVKSGNMPARTILRANILLAVDRNGKPAYDCARGCHSLQHVCHYSLKRQDSLWEEGTRRNHSAKKNGRHRQ